MIILDKVDSTNNYAMALIKNGRAEQGTCILARQQTAGKGRRGKSWLAAHGKNLLASLIIRPEWASPQLQFELSQAAAIAVSDLLLEHLQQKISIKWPNDIFINDSKAAGLLIENVISGTKWQWAVIGVGININQEAFDTHAFDATSWHRVTGRHYDVLSLATRLRQLLLARIEEWQAGEDHYSLYEQRLYARGKSVRLKAKGRVFETTISGVTPEGQLITSDTLERHWSMDDVEFRGVIE